MAGHTYVYVAARDLMTNAPLFDTFTSQLHDAINNPHFLLAWSRLHPTMLLWVLVVGGCAAIERPQWLWFVRQVRRVISILRITTFSHFRRILAQVVWLERPFKDSLHALWSDLEDRIHPVFGG